MPVVELQRKLLVVEDPLVSTITFNTLAIIVRHQDQRHTNRVYHMAMIQVFHVWRITIWVSYTVILSLIPKKRAQFWLRILPTFSARGDRVLRM